MSVNKETGSNQAEQQNKIAYEAAEWFLLLQSEYLDDDQLQEFDAWLAQSADHRETYLEVELANDALNELVHAEQGQYLNDLLNVEATENTAKKQNIWTRFKEFFGEIPVWQTAVMASVFIMMASVFINFDSSNNGSVSDFVAYDQHLISAPGEVKHILLRDGTKVTLGAHSKLNVRLEKNQRRVTLSQGEAFFDVAKDSSRPFYVSAGKLSIKVVGTMFDVRKRIENVSVGVVEGVVQVFPVPIDELDNNALATPTSLVAGQQIKFDKEQVLQRDLNVTLSEMASWRNGVLIYKSAALKDVLADANRYLGDEKIMMDGETLLDQPITLSLNTSQISDLPQILVELLPIKVKQVSGRTILVAQ